jgi:hypothetical protein
MKILSVTAFAILIFAFTSCKSNGTKDEHAGHDMQSMAKDTAQHVIDSEDKEVKTVAVLYSNLDVKVATSIKEIVDHYLHVKNALANDNATEAAIGSKAMEAVLGKIDKSILTAEQKLAYDKMEGGLKETSSSIAKGGDNIKQQRVQFVMMSEAIYGLVKDFGAGRPIYHDHCPMARDNQGAMWISEIREVKNPYFGSAMPACGTVEEVIK